MDTRPEAERVQIELMRKMSPAKKFGLVRSMTQTMIQASRENIRRLHPNANEEELTLIFIELYYGKELANRVGVDRERRKVEGTDRPFIDASPEDTILNKLEWYKMGGEVSDRQWNDILGVLKVQGAALDMNYLQRWAAVLDVTDLLESALVDAGLKE